MMNIGRNSHIVFASMKKKIIASIIFSFVYFFIVFTASAFAEGPAKRIEVSLAQQRLRAYEHDQLKYDFIVSTGKSATPTPRGGF